MRAVERVAEGSRSASTALTLWCPLASTSAGTARPLGATGLKVLSKPEHKAAPGPPGLLVHGSHTLLGHVAVRAQAPEPGGPACSRHRKVQAASGGALAGREDVAGAAAQPLKTPDCPHPWHLQAQRPPHRQRLE